LRFAPATLCRNRKNDGEKNNNNQKTPKEITAQVMAFHSLPLLVGVSGWCRAWRTLAIAVSVRSGCRSLSHQP